ncbi:MAG TPA: PBP1A family penicillin-binding protein [Fibrobacteraceae bacterium]|nr:PBP1A family penicillin-binding protein [Fibrobacteraceae bacterium]
MKPDRRQLLWTLLLSTPLVFALVAGLATVFYLRSSLPSLSQLEQINPRLVTRLYDKDSNLVHEFFVERRIWTPIDSIPDLVKHAVIATEDRKFYDHWGMNPWAIPSAVLESALSGKKLRGASTLTQQLAKVLFLTPERSIVRKMREAMTAIRIEQTYTKEEILEFYLNQVCLGAGTYGFQAAGQFYFGKPLDSLSLPEAAMLAGMLQRPEAYRPDKHPVAAKERRNTVLYAMYDAGYIDHQTYKEAVRVPIVAAEKEDDGSVGPYFVEEVRKYLERKYGENSLYADGVSVYTTLDQNIQRYADSVSRAQVEVVRRKLKYRHARLLGLPQKYKMPMDSVVAHFDSIYTLFSKQYLARDTAAADSDRKFPDSTRYHRAEVALVLIENQQGAVRALVGGSDFRLTKFNRAIQSLRQPGSSFKPFVYATAMDNGASPCDSVNDQPITLPDPMDTTGTKFWRPSNYEDDFQGMMTLRKALYQSKNLPAILTGMKYGLNNVVSYARKFGLKAPLKPVPSLAIGSIGATLMEMTSAYTVFPNGGTRIEPYMVESIVGKNGEVMERNMKVEHEVLKKPSAYLMVNMMQDVNVRGTAAKVWASGFTHPSGGKTGTTNKYTDAWYIGYTKQYTMGVWVGTDANVGMGPGHTGGDDALPIWISVMKTLHDSLPKEHFPVPEGVVARQICQVTGKIAGEFCSLKSLCLYSAGYAPTEVCDGNHLSNGKPKEGANLFGGPSQTTPSDKKKSARKTF